MPMKVILYGLIGGAVGYGLSWVSRRTGGG